MVQPVISVVVPVYKEEGNIVPFLERTIPVLEAIGPYEILFCLDPSPDRTEEVICREAAANPSIGLMVFSRRFGQPAATMAGILNCRGESCVVIDVDLQDQPELIGALHAKLREGYDVVCAKRRRGRKGETALKKLISFVGYWLINHVSDVDIPRDTGDFRIMSRRTIEALRHLPERHGFLRGLVAFAGFRQASVEYDRDARAAGMTKYNPFTGSFKIGFNGLFGFSTFPLAFILWLGVVVATLSFVIIVLMFLARFVFGVDYPLGVPTITVGILFIGSVQLVAIGVLGEYVGRVYEEVRHRPLYIVDRTENLVVRNPWGPQPDTMEPAAPGEGSP